MRYSLSHHRTSCGFTLVELVVVLVVTGILAALGGMFIVQPIQGFLDLSRRARLVDSAETALRRMQRDVRQALPNSVRINGAGTALELLHTVDGGRYRAYGPGNTLDFTGFDTDFEALGDLDTAPTPGQSIVVYNLSGAGTNGNAYFGDNRAGVGAGSTVNSVILDPPFQFPRSSPFQRFFIVDQPVSYICDTGAGTLTRYTGYGISAIQSNTPGGTPALMANNVSQCNFTYQPGTAQRAGLVTLRLQITEDGESVTLLHQIHVENAP
ncbi:pilus assembly protein MshO [Syntrophotalea acetylenivorans]|uniref:Pilus assembly protein MshO n=1 Tax=Syntrophotalea acetylenivorans TaxID=1842532 RepID=A0A1L3GPN1_9BACT|nr:prepilin-type N-terminal cleavage/methylation domain-containing protein [Syntrophotalea acetylenivorans]APG27863.1 pilus assembly protein MshO [Syntrophotalea acetylenivorans]